MKIDAKHLAGWALLFLGVLAWAGNGSALLAKGEFEARPNVLTLKGSPFGRTLAVAMRGPVDVYWHKGEAHHHTAKTDPGHECEGCDAGDDACRDHLATTADPAREAIQGTTRGSLPRWNLRTFALDQIDDWRKAFYTRTNPYGSTKVHQAYIMGETEKRLRLSYEMDPTNFSTYGSYFLFMSEALAAIEGAGGNAHIRASAEEAALQLSARTVQSCLAHRDEPGPLLTAAAAAHDHAHLLFARRNPEADRGARHFVAIQDACLRDFRALKQRMQSEGTWAGIPSMRLLEMEVQENLLNKYLEANLSFLAKRVSDHQPKPSNPNAS